MLVQYMKPKASHLGMLCVCFSLTACVISPERARSASDKSLCEANVTVAHALANEVRKEIERRGLDCYNYERDLAERNRTTEENRQRANQQKREVAVKNAEEMTVLCGYCAKIYPQEIAGKCLGVTRFSCGALWDDGKRAPSLPNSAPSYNCQRIGSQVNCNPY